MPGSTALGIPYPYNEETVDADSVRLLAEQVDTLINADFTAVNSALARNRVGVSRPGTGQSVSPATLTYLTFTQEDWDSNGMANLGVNNDRITAVQAGYYYVSLYVAQLSAATTCTFYQQAIMLDTSERILFKKGGWVSWYNTCAGVVKCNAGETIRARVYWAGTGTFSLFSWLRAYRIRPL